MKDVLNKILNNSITRAVILIATILLFIGVIRWLGFKGMVGLVLGMAIMAWIFLSKNVLVRMIINKVSGTDEYIDLIKKGE